VNLARLGWIKHILFKRKGWVVAKQCDVALRTRLNCNVLAFRPSTTDQVTGM
jgi:hypothetical protein